MQRTADFPNHIAHARLPQAARVVDDAAALDAAVDVLDTDPAPRDPPIGRFLRARESPAPWLLRGHDDLDLVTREGQEAESLEPPAAGGQRVRVGIGNPLIVGAAGIGLTQKEDRERGIDQQHVFDRVVLFLAALTARVRSRILGARDAPFGPIVATRGEAATGRGCPSKRHAAKGAQLRDEFPGEKLDIFLRNGIGQEQLQKSFVGARAFLARHEAVSESLSVTCLAPIRHNRPHRIITAQRAFR